MKQDVFEKLKIDKVDTPPFLFTRIQTKINQLQFDVMPKKTTWAIGFAFAIILSVNFSVLIRRSSPSNDAQSYAQSLNLITDNTLYK